MKKCLLSLVILLSLVGCDGDEKNYYNSPTEVDAPVNAFASFDWNYLSTNLVTCLGQGCGIQFIDRSTNARRWAWNFGDGGTSNLANPVHFYRDDFCTITSNCSYVINLQVCPAPDMRFDDDLCSAAQGVVLVPAPH